MSEDMNRPVLAAALLVLCAMTGPLAGCVTEPRIVRPPGLPDIPHNQTPGPCWAAYNFDCTTVPAGGGPGKVLGFTGEVNTVIDGSNSRFRLDVRTQGIFNETVLVNRTVQSINATTFNVTTDHSTVNITMRCYRIQHSITVLQDGTGTLPLRAEVTLSIPVNVTGPTGIYQWLWPRANYSDSAGRTGLWSFWLNGSMWDRMNASTTQATVSYLPRIEGCGLLGFDNLVLGCIYGYGWPWFGVFATSGRSRLEPGTDTKSINGAPCTYLIQNLTRTIGGINLNAYDVTAKRSDPSGPVENRAVLTPDLPVPLHIKIADTAPAATYEYSLTGLSLG